MLSRKFNPTTGAFKTQQETPKNGSQSSKYLEETYGNLTYISTTRIWWLAYYKTYLKNTNHCRNSRWQIILWRQYLNYWEDLWIFQWTLTYWTKNKDQEHQDRMKNKFTLNPNTRIPAWLAGNTGTKSKNFWHIESVNIPKWSYYNKTWYVKKDFRNKTKEEK